jgi:actin-related protein
MATPMRVEDFKKIALDSLHNIFDEAYETINLTFEPHIKMPRRGRYQVWKGGEILADRIKHRREALAIMKLMQATQE